MPSSYGETRSYCVKYKVCSIMMHDHILKRICSDHELNGSVDNREVKLRGLTSGTREVKLERLSNVESTSFPGTLKHSSLTRLSTSATQRTTHHLLSNPRLPNTRMPSVRSTVDRLDRPSQYGQKSVSETSNRLGVSLSLIHI